jgi:nicotinamidase-related amidase
VDEFQLRRSDAALVVIDLQYASASRDHGYGEWLAIRGRASQGEYRFSRIEREVIPNVRRLLEFARAAEIPRLFIKSASHLPDYSDLTPHRRRMQATLGNLVDTPTNSFINDVAPQVGDIVLVKSSTSAFTTTNIDFLLRNLVRGQLIFTGVSTSQCVDLTARDAADRGYDCVIVEDAVAEDSEFFHQSSLELFKRLFGVVRTTDEILGELRTALPSK